MSKAAKIYPFTKQSNAPIAQEQFEITLNRWRRNLCTKNKDELSEKAIRALGIIQHLVNSKKVRGYQYFAGIFNRSRDQVKRYFDEIEEAGICTVLFRRSAEIRGKKYKNILDFSFTEKGLLELGLQGKVMPHSFAAKMRGTYISNDNNKDKEIEESLKAFSSISSYSSKEETTRAREEEINENASLGHGSLDEPAQELEGHKKETNKPVNTQFADSVTLPSHPANMTAAEEKARYFEHRNRSHDPNAPNPLIALLSQLEIIEAREENLEKTTELDQKKQLETRIVKTFSTDLSKEILVNCSFNLLGANKLQICITKGFNLTDCDKRLIREQIWAVYGVATQITAKVSQPAFKNLSPSLASLTSVDNTPACWAEIREDLTRHYGEPIVKSWFDNLKVQEEPQGKRLFLQGGFAAQRIYQMYLDVLERYVAKRGYDFELIEVDAYLPPHRLYYTSANNHQSFGG